MAPLFIGIFVLLFGIAVIANAAFSERAQLGFYICLGGAAFIIGGILELIF